MRLTEGDLPPTLDDDTLAAFDRVQPIAASDAEIEAAVRDADLPALLAALAMLTQDPALLADELKPPSPSMTARIAPQGGLSAEAQAKARTLATQALIRYRDAGCPEAPTPSPEWLDRIVQFLIRDGHEDLMDLLRHEVNVPDDRGAPGWHVSDFPQAAGTKVAVIGSGFAGITAAYRLKQAGLDFTVFEKNREIGGVWWENTYPGCRLDTPNFAYSLSFAQKQDWTQQFSQQPEILRYLLDVVRRTGIRPHIRVNTEVESLEFDEDQAAWKVTARTPDGSAHVEHFHFVITAMGLLNRPHIPDFPGLASFKGEVVHSAAWRPDVNVKGKRVALIGTGASAFQIGPEIYAQVSRLSVFQRNPPWMLPTPTYHDDLKPGIRWLLGHVPSYGRWVRFWQFWIGVEGRLHLVELDPAWQHPVSISAGNEALRQECLAMLQQQFADRPDLLAHATPDYPPGAKRMLRDNGTWPQMLKAGNVGLVTQGISHLSENAIHTTDGQRHEVDLIICATGFKAADFLYPLKVTGRAGQDLHRHWDGDCRAYLGISVPGFPNLFMTSGPNTGVVVNGSAIFSSECQVEYTLRALRHVLSQGHRTVDCRPEPYAQYNAWIDQGNETKAWAVAKTSSWYKNKSGRAAQTWPFGMLEYWNLTARFRPEDHVLA
ncbi:flavin-containing monooxygenase [Hydrogenophaga borbori]|uniref:flavin-containing monooxygenase n=1 Tax=Hydrogenophaga borbori TaxID=2294117 RepID=UPI0011C0DE18|nr:NAD(P)/FAD-dependent oxidoreductase [Hydrogenophaga borbori]